MIARQEFVDELSLWNDTEDVKSSVLLPSKYFFLISVISKLIKNFSLAKCIEDKIENNSQKVEKSQLMLLNEFEEI